MAARKSWGAHGTVRRYRQGGCDDLRGGQQGYGDRCDACKISMRDYTAGRKAGFTVPINSNIVPIDKRKLRHFKPTDEPDDKKCGPAERAVHRQLGPYSDSDPVYVELALNAARILDNRLQSTLHTAASKQMDLIIDRLTGGKKVKSKGKLAAVAAMTPSRKLG